VLPTGAGKTYIALKAIERLRKSTLIIVPTIPLLNQWSDLLTKLGIEAGIIGGGKSELRPVTVITYDSAYLRSDELGNKFELVVFDEVHHLAAAGYIEIGESLASPYRMGLTATLEREDGRHSLLFPIVGGVVYRIGPKELAGTHLSEFDTVRIGVELSEEERAEYDKCLREYREALRDLKLRITGMEDFMKLIRMSSSNPTARKALLAWHRMRKIALNSRSKLDTLQSLLESHKDDKVIIFTEFNEMAEEISRRFLIPLITHRTDKKERKEVLDAFRVGSVTKIVTSKVLDEGLDVPDARVGIILGGTGSRREFVQRLGRILWKREGKRAVLYEVISRGTSEVRVSRRRRKALQR
jgi:superfamily II DNA or RNA helicase